MTLHTHDTDTPGKPVKVLTPKKKPAKKTKARAKGKVIPKKVTDAIIKDEIKINVQWQKFVENYTGLHLGNALRSYMEVYKCDYATAKSEGSRLLTNPNIKEMIRASLDKQGFTDENTDAHHLFLINQFEDYSSKLGAIKEYNRITKRVDDSPKNEIILADPIKLKKIWEVCDRINNRT